ncbi:MAG: hypothetical protein QOD98_3075 [Nocardioidaceae bacterium]|nr:hypothetical protein [Nocardioidaceae bacterium]
MALVARVARVAALLTAVVLFLTTALSAQASPARRDNASWSGLDVWHFRLKTSHGFTYPVSIDFEGSRLPYPRPGVTAIAATADTAVVQLTDYEQDVGLGRLVELPATGATGRSLDRHPLGTVLADPNGHVAFWSGRRSDGPHLMALDTTTGARIVGPAVRSRQRVFAVEGSTAYVVDGVFTADPRTYTWTPGQAGLAELPGTFDHGGIISDVSGDRVLSFDLDDGLYVTDPAGTLLRTLPVLFGTFSPDTAHLVGYRGERVALYETETGVRVRLSGLHGRSASAARWSPGGVLVVDTLPRHTSGDDAEPVLTFACSATVGRCRQLPGRVYVGALPWLPMGALGQFYDYVPSS